MASILPVPPSSKLSVRWFWRPTPELPPSPVYGPGPYHRGQAHQHLILRSLGSLLLKYLSWFKPYPSPSIFLLLLLLPRSSGCCPLCSSVCRRWTDTNTRPCSCSIGFYPLGAQVGAGTIPSVLVHHLCFSEPFQCLVTSFLSPVVCTFLKI